MKKPRAKEKNPTKNDDFKMNPLHNSPLIDIKDYSNKNLKSSRSYFRAKIDTP
jgi:hypothetical protein